MNEPNQDLTIALLCNTIFSHSLSRTGDEKANQSPNFVSSPLFVWSSCSCTCVRDAFSCTNMYTYIFFLVCFLYGCGVRVCVNQFVRSFEFSLRTDFFLSKLLLFLLCALLRRTNKLRERRRSILPKTNQTMSIVVNETCSHWMRVHTKCFRLDEETHSKVTTTTK